MDWLTIILTITNVLFCSKVAADWFKDRRERRDKGESIADVNEGKKIDAAALATKLISDRLQIVESRVDTLGDKLTAVMVENATLGAEKVALTEERERMRERMHNLAENLQSKEGEIHSLREEHHKTQLALSALTVKFEATEIFESFWNKEKNKGISRTSDDQGVSV